MGSGSASGSGSGSSGSGSGASSSGTSSSGAGAGASSGGSSGSGSSDDDSGTEGDGSTCADSTCTLTVLASGNTPTGIVVDGTSVYWVDGTSVYWVDATSVYWVDHGVSGNNNGTVMKVALDGGTPTVLASGHNAPIGIAVDATSVYWTDERRHRDEGVQISSQCYWRCLLALPRARPIAAPRRSTSLRKGSRPETGVTRPTELSISADWSPHGHFARGSVSPCRDFAGLVASRNGISSNLAETLSFVGPEAIGRASSCVRSGWRRVTRRRASHHEVCMNPIGSDPPQTPA
jgi:hypothetical protein